MQETKRINRFILLTVLISTVITELGLMKYVGNYGVRLLLSQLIFAVPMFSYLVVYKVPFKAAVGLKKIRISDILLSILFYILIKYLMTFLNAVSLVFTKNSIGEVIYTLSDQVPFIVGILFVAIIPAVFEELVYRGLIYQCYRKVNPLWAIIMSGLVFGLMHGNFNQFLYASALGMAFAILNEATGSIVSSMVVHMLTNLISTTIVYLIPWMVAKLTELINSMPELAGSFSGILGTPGTGGETDTDALVKSLFSPDSTSIVSSLPLYGILAAIGTVLAFLVLRYIAKRNNRWEHIVSIFKGTKEENTGLKEEMEIQPGWRIITRHLLPAIVILVVNIIYYELAVHGVIGT